MEKYIFHNFENPHIKMFARIIWLCYQTHLGVLGCFLYMYYILWISQSASVLSLFPKHKCTTAFLITKIFPIKLLSILYALGKVLLENNGITIA